MVTGHSEDGTGLPFGEEVFASDVVFALPGSYHCDEGLPIVKGRGEVFAEMGFVFPDEFEEQFAHVFSHVFSGDLGLGRVLLLEFWFGFDGERGVGGMVFFR